MGLLTVTNYENSFRDKCQIHQSCVEINIRSTLLAPILAPEKIKPRKN